VNSSKLSNRRLVAILFGVCLVGASLLLVLYLIPHRTVVEMTVLTRRASFQLEVPESSNIDTGILATGLTATHLEVRGADEVTFALEPAGGRTTLALPEGGPLALRQERGFRPRLGLRDTLAVTLGVEGGHGLRIILGPVAPGEEPWFLSAGSREPLGMSVSGRTEPEMALPSWFEVRKSPAVRMSGGRRQARVGLALAGGSGPVTSRIDIIDLESGRVTSHDSLAVDPPSETVYLPHDDQLYVLRGNRAEGGAVMLLQPDLSVVSPRFHRRIDERWESQLVGGEIRFPAGEMEPVSLREGFYVTCNEGATFNLRSVELTDGLLALTLWGTPGSLRVGPTPQLRSQKLPSLLVWLYTHRFGQLSVSFIMWIIGTALAALRFFGKLARD